MPSKVVLGEAVLSLTSSSSPPQSLSEIILISCENDLHLCGEYFARGIGRRCGARPGRSREPLVRQVCGRGWHVLA